MDTDELSLHYTLTMDDDHHQDSDNNHDNDCFDPFDTNKQQQDNIDVDVDININGDNDTDINSNDSTDNVNAENANVENDAVAQNNAKDDSKDDIKDSMDVIDDDEDTEEEDDDDEDDDLRKELEEIWEKQEKDKNKGICKIIEKIRNKSNNKSPLKTINDNPKINPFVFDGNIKITFPSNNINDNNGNKTKIDSKQLHFHPRNMLNKRKKIKYELKKQVSKKRKYEMKKYRKEFGKHNEYFNNEKIKMKQHEEEQEQEEEEEENEEEKEEMEEEVEDDIDDDDDIINTINNDEDDNDDDDEYDELYREEELARAALMAKPEKISSELRQVIDIAADEEDENGEIVENKNDIDKDEKFGIVKNLLAEKCDIKLLNKHKEIYDIKRNEIHQKLLHKDDDKQFELIKRAFIDGEYRKFQKKHGMNNNNDNNDGENELLFKSRNSEIDYKNHGEYYLSDNEEKNEFCCYDENGLFYDIHTIRMKIMEWNKIHNNFDDDDEEDKETMLLRQKRVQKREQNDLNNIDGFDHNKINKNDKNAIRILDKVRNKKKLKKKKPTLTKSNTIDTAILPILQRSNSSSFLKHRDKCIEINNNNSQNNYNGGGNNNSKKAVIFQKYNKSRKRKGFYNDNENNNDNFKKRRI